MVEPNSDSGIERCEALVIAAWKTEAEKGGEQRSSRLERSAVVLERYLERQIRFEALVEELERWLTPREYSAGDALAAPDAQQKALHLPHSGGATAYDAEGKRFHQCGPGDAIWPSGDSKDGAATAAADEACRTMALTRAGQYWLEDQKERFALALYRYLLCDPTRRSSGESS
ncbi:MAG: hypothetical protein OXN84_20785 [Albidovulum sp.]|nr:hypothetical protein [Albidovulum sp.]